MDLSSVNFLGVIAAAVSYFVVGGIWYSPLLFSKAWVKENGFTEEDINKRNKGAIFGGSFVLSLIISFCMAVWLGYPRTASGGMIVGAVIGIGFVSTALGIVYLFEGKSIRLFLINAGYNAIAFIVAGTILGAL